MSAEGDVEEQPLLIVEPTDDGAVLFSGSELRKRYTARHVTQIERVRDAVIMLLGAGWPVENIAGQLKMNIRTVHALALREAEKVAGSKNDMIQILRGFGMKAFAHAAVKLPQATAAQAAVAGGIALDKARDLEMTGAGVEEKVVTEDTDHVRAAAELRALMESLAPVAGATGREASAETSAIDSVSSGDALTVNELRNSDGECIQSDAPTDTMGTGYGACDVGGSGPVRGGAAEAGGGSRGGPESE